MLRRARAEDSGFSLAELLVAITVLGFLLVMSATILAWTGNAVLITQGTAQGAGTASDIMDELSTVIRSGSDQPVVNQLVANPPFLAAGTESLTMVSYVNSYTSSTNTAVRPQLVQFSLNAKRQLIESRWLPSATNGSFFTFPATTTTPYWQRNFGGPLLATPTSPAGSNPLFVYLTSTGAVVSNPTTTAQFLTIASVEVTVRVLGAPKAARPDVVLQNVVNIPNISLTGN